MNKFNASPYIPPLDRDDPVITGTRTYTWSNVNFIEDGRYDVHSNTMTQQNYSLMIN